MAWRGRVVTTAQPPGSIPSELVSGCCLLGSYITLHQIAQKNRRNTLQTGELACSGRIQAICCSSLYGADMTLALLFYDGDAVEAELYCIVKEVLKGANSLVRGKQRIDHSALFLPFGCWETFGQKPHHE